MIKKVFNLRNILILSFLSSVFLLALTKTHDFDAWIHLTMGRLIWTLKGFPEKEPFLYTILDKPFEYSSWLFGVIYYLSYKLFNTYGVIILKASTITLAFYILLKDSLLITDSREQTTDNREQTQLIIAILVLSIAAILTRPRFVERPDTFLMIFLPFSIYSLNAYIYQGKKYIYCLPFVHLLWANSHSSINLMFIPFGAVLAGEIIGGFKGLRFKGVEGSRGKIKTILIFFALSFAAALINPNFIGQFTFALQFMKTGWFKKGISELMPATWINAQDFYILGAALLLSFVLKIAVRKRISSQDISNLLLIIPFVYLAQGAIRFIFIFAVVAVPIMARNISDFIDGLYIYKKRELSPLLMRVFFAAAVIWMAAYSYSALSRTWIFERDIKEIGFGFKLEQVPEKALRFMDENSIYGRVFNEFEYGQYITWRDFPKRQASIDGRGSVGEDLFVMTTSSKYYQPLLLPKFYEKYGFKSFLIKIPHSVKDINSFVESDEWALVYWDDVSMLYLKRGAGYDDVINQWEYKFLKPALGISYHQERLKDRAYFEGSLLELQRNKRQSGSYLAMILEGFSLMHTESFDKAKEVFQAIVNDPGAGIDPVAKAYDGIGILESVRGNISEAVAYYKKSINLRESYMTLYNLGMAYLSLGMQKKAVRSLERAIKLEPAFEPPYFMLRFIYEKAGSRSDVERIKRLYRNKNREQKQGHIPYFFRNMGCVPVFVMGCVPVLFLL